MAGLMLYAIEGGSFFSSSVSGYSKGLTLLLLGHKNKEKPMRVTPWNHYQLVGQDTDLDFQLASGKGRHGRGWWANFVCFGCAAASRIESPTPLRVGPIQKQEVLPGPNAFDKTKNPKNLASCVVDVNLKSSLKKATNSAPKASTCDGVEKENEALCERDNSVACQMERKVHWTDMIGGELFEIREFEMSEDDSSDDDFDHSCRRTCSCSIM